MGKHAMRPHDGDEVQVRPSVRLSRRELIALERAGLVEAPRLRTPLATGETRPRPQRAVAITLSDQIKESVHPPRVNSAQSSRVQDVGVNNTPHSPAEVHQETEVLSCSEVAESVAYNVATVRRTSRPLLRDVRDESAPLTGAKPRLDRTRRRLALAHKGATPQWTRRYRACVLAAAGTLALLTPLANLGLTNLRAQAAPPLSASIVGGTEHSATLPPSLSGSATAGIKSATNSAAAEAASHPIAASCSADSAQGVRAAFVKDDADLVVYPIARGSYTLSSHFGYRSDPFSGTRTYHAGEDFAAAYNTPILAIADGTVIHAGAGIRGRSSNLIIVEHTIGGHTYQSWYIHMFNDGVLVTKGDKVKAGQQIGRVGSNGYSTGPHLHLEIHDPSAFTGENSETDLMDPLTFLRDNSAIDISDICS